MKKIALALAAVCALSLPVMAADTKIAVITNTALYDRILELQLVNKRQDQQITLLRSVASKENVRIQALEAKVKQLDEQLSAEVATLSMSVATLQRKVGGVQKQVTILHSKTNALSK